MYKIQWNHHTEEEANWETENFLQRNFPDFLRTNPGTKSLHPFLPVISGRDSFQGGEAVTPQVSAQQLCIYCMHHVLELLEKGSFCKYKGYMCNYNFMQSPFCSCILIGCEIIALVEGVFAKCSVIITWQEYFQFSLSLK